MCASAAFLWFLLSEATSVEIQPNLITALISQHQPSKFDYYVCMNTEDLSAFVGRIWAFVGIWACAGKDSGFPGKDSGSRDLRAEAVEATAAATDARASAAATGSADAPASAARAEGAEAEEGDTEQSSSDSELPDTTAPCSRQG